MTVLTRIRQLPSPQAASRGAPPSPGAAHPLLKPLNPLARAELIRCGERVRHPQRSAIVRAREPISRLLFIDSGTASIIASACPGEGVEVGSVRGGGLIGVTALFGGTEFSQDVIARSELRGLSVSAQAVMDAVSSNPSFGAALRAYALARIGEIVLLSGCNARHSVEQRLARWLLSHAGEGGELRVTHEELAQLLGVRRATITTVLHNLEGERALRSLRGAVQIRDTAALRLRSCGCAVASNTAGAVSATAGLRLTCDAEGLAV